MTTNSTTAQVYTVSGLTRQIKTLLENTYPFVWLTGEISNLATPASGHCYFSLKDDTAVISSVMFRNQRRRLGFQPENGMRIVGLGRLSIYEPRGTYQIIFEHMEPEGAGLLHARFELLKKKLSSEGLFDAAHKRPLPFLPSRISIITSPTGAVIRDIIHVAQRRFPSVHLQVVPVRVQGNGAETDIVTAIRRVCDQDTSQVIIIARGGGSLEDLAAFNTESVARAVFAATIPVVSAVGHETDFTICDFTADLRAPTPSAAAELCLPEKIKLQQNIQSLQTALTAAQYRCVQSLRDRCTELMHRLKSPSARVDDWRLRVGDLENRLFHRLSGMVSSHREKLAWVTTALHGTSPAKQLSESRHGTLQVTRRLHRAMQVHLKGLQARVDAPHSKLGALSPLAILERGYSITRTCDAEKRVITDAMETQKHERVEVLLSSGRLHCLVEKRYGQKENL